MENKRPLLSICIPTYNRSRYLKSNLLAIFNQVKGKDDIEIIISNNCSTDETESVAKPYLNIPFVKYYKQVENIGGIKNILKLAKEYANGEFCWIIGDDDFIVKGAIERVITIIKKYPNIDYIYAKISHLSMQEYNTSGVLQLPSYVEASNNLKTNFEIHEIAKFEELISPQYSIIFLGELMGSIFRRKIWLQYNLQPQGEYLTTLETTYPHCVILANTFFGKKAIYTKMPLVLALDGAREWWYKVGYILIVHVKSLLDLYKEKGLDKHILKKCYQTYIEITFSYAVKYLMNKNSPQRNQISLSQYFLFLLMHPILFCKVFMAIILRYIKTSICSSLKSNVI